MDISSKKMETYEIDLGNGLTKVKAKGKYYCFRSTIVTNRNVVKRSDDTHIVNIDGIGCIIGAKDGKTFAGERRYDRSDYLYTLLTAICVGHNNEEDPEINAIVHLNLPLELYQKEEYRNKLLKFEGIKKEVIVDGVKYNINIVGIIPMAEGLLLNTLKQEEVEDKRNIFLDFGYGTLDVIVAYGYIIEQIKTYKLGINNLYNLIANKLNTTMANIEYYYDMPDKAIIDCKPKDITEYKRNGLIEYTDNILNLIESLVGGSFEGIYKFYFLGGGSNVIYNNFAECIENMSVLVPNSLYSNVDIFESLLKQREQMVQEQDEKIAKLEESKAKLIEEENKQNRIEELKKQIAAEEAEVDEEKELMERLRQIRMEKEKLKK